MGSTVGSTLLDVVRRAGNEAGLSESNGDCSFNLEGENWRMHAAAINYIVMVSIWTTIRGVSQPDRGHDGLRRCETSIFGRKKAAPHLAT
jgi:hypothetical protein